MRRFSYLATLLLSLIPLRGVTYYVSKSGSDAANDGRSLSSSFATIQKAADLMKAGDTCYIRAGVYREATLVRSSGTLAQPITFSAYASETVTIDGTDLIDGWLQEGPNIYYAPMGWTLGDGDQVFQSGVMRPEARWPNAGPDYPWQDSALAHPSYDELGDWSYVNTAGYDASKTNGWFTDAQLPSRPDGYWVGATVHIMSGYGWIMQHPVVTAYVNSGRKITTNDNQGGMPSSAIRGGNEFYLTGIKAELDSSGEWFRDTSTGRLYLYSAIAPIGVHAKRRVYGFDIGGRAYVTLANLSFFACTIRTEGSTYATFDRLKMSYLGHSRKVAATFGLRLGTGSVLRNSELAWDSQGLVYPAGNDIRIINNSLHDSGYVPYWDSALNGYGSRNLASHNTIYSTGRSAVGSLGRASLFQYNDLHDAMRLTTDGGVLYAYQEAANSIIRYNFLHDSIGPSGHAGASIQGLYFDCLSSNSIVHNNIIWNIPGYAFQFNARHNYLMVFNNTAWGAAEGALTTAATQDGETGSRIYNNLFCSALDGVMATWRLTDFRANLYAYPNYVSPYTANFQLAPGSPAIDRGRVVPGITDGYVGVAPDIGALESGAANWTLFVGRRDMPPVPDPVYDLTYLSCSNKIRDGSFESANLPAYWTVASGSAANLNNSGSFVSGFQGLSRSGYYSLKCVAGTSEISQTIAGLLPYTKYRAYAAVKTTDTAAKIYLGVSGGGLNDREILLAGGTGGSWRMLDVPFYNGSGASNLRFYLKIVSATATPVYADDLGLELDPSDPDPQPYPMPVAAYAFDESTGNVAHDVTTLAHDATLANATFSAGRRGNALVCNGTTSYASVPAVLIPSAGHGSFTVSFWVRFDDTGTGSPSLASNNNQSWRKKGWYVVANANRSVGIYLWPQDNPASDFTVWTSETAVAGVWTHVAFVLDRAKGMLIGYRDGVPSVATTLPAGFDDIDSLAGLRIGSTTLKGCVDDFQIWDQALSAEAVKIVATSDTALELRLRLDDASGSAKGWDASGRGRQATLVALKPATAWNGDSLHFDGTGYAQVATLGSAPSGSFTVSFSVRFDDTGSGTPALASNNNGSWLKKGWYITGSASRTLGLYLWTKDSSLATDSPATGITSWTTQPIIPGIWTRIAYVIDRENGTLARYRNGLVEASASLPVGFADVATSYGPRLGSSAFRGDLKDFRYYSRPLDSTEIAEESDRVNALQGFRVAYSLPANGAQDVAATVDSVSPLLKYAFNMLGSVYPGQAPDLTTPNASILAANGYAGLPLVTLDAGTGRLSVTYIRRNAASNSGIAYQVQFCDNLGASAGWSPNPSATESVVALDDTFERVTVIDTLTPSPRRFARVRVTVP